MKIYSCYLIIGIISTKVDIQNKTRNWNLKKIKIEEPIVKNLENDKNSQNNFLSKKQTDIIQTPDLNIKRVVVDNNLQNPPLADQTPSKEDLEGIKLVLPSGYSIKKLGDSDYPSNHNITETEKNREDVESLINNQYVIKKELKTPNLESKKKLDDNQAIKAMPESKMILFPLNARNQNHSIPSPHNFNATKPPEESEFLSTNPTGKKYIKKKPLLPLNQPTTHNNIINSNKIEKTKPKWFKGNSNFEIYNNISIPVFLQKDPGDLKNLNDNLKNIENIKTKPKTDLHEIKDTLNSSNYPNQEEPNVDGLTDIRQRDIKQSDPDNDDNHKKIIELKAEIKKDADQFKIKKQILMKVQKPEEKTSQNEKKEKFQDQSDSSDSDTSSTPTHDSYQKKPVLDLNYSPKKKNNEPNLSENFDPRNSKKQHSSKKITKRSVGDYNPQDSTLKEEQNDKKVTPKRDEEITDQKNENGEVSNEKSVISEENSTFKPDDNIVSNEDSNKKNDHKNIPKDNENDEIMKYKDYFLEKFLDVLLKTKKESNSEKTEKHIKKPNPINKSYNENLDPYLDNIKNPREASFPSPDLINILNHDRNIRKPAETNYLPNEILFPSKSTEYYNTLFMHSPEKYEQKNYYPTDPDNPLNNGIIGSNKNFLLINPYFQEYRNDIERNSDMDKLKKKYIDNYLKNIYISLRDYFKNPNEKESLMPENKYPNNPHNMLSKISFHPYSTRKKRHHYKKPSQKALDRIHLMRHLYYIEEKAADMDKKKKSPNRSFKEKYFENAKPDENKSTNSSLDSTERKNNNHKYDIEDFSISSDHKQDQEKNKEKNTEDLIKNRYREKIQNLAKEIIEDASKLKFSDPPALKINISLKNTCQTDKNSEC